MSDPGPLARVKVLDLSRMFPGAFCTVLLADLGADVVKVEAPGLGDGLRSMAPPGQFNATHTALNRGKRSIAVDLRHDRAADVLKHLVRWADVVVESHRPGQLDAMGLGYEAMRDENPALVWCSITGFGTTGPNAVAPGHDLTYLGHAGLLARLAEGATTPPGVTISIPLAASLAAVGILAAVTEAIRSGKGTKLDANMTDSAMWVLAEDVARAANAPGPGWGELAGRNVYTCADGGQITVAATEPKTWAALCGALDAPDLLGHRLGVDEGPLITRLAEAFRSKPAAEWLADPGLAGGVGPVNDVDDLLDDPQVTERQSLATLSPSGARVLANPLRLAGANGVDATLARADAPALGEHTQAVLLEAGLTRDEFLALQSEGAIS